ncbi:MAG: hypothetical protein CM15mP22_1510 [Gammaproteobacteria bacterium]|nr:MAG: hypothetical protein CM15mP22_1510 [Gammaproteobacteria bacterium]
MDDNFSFVSAWENNGDISNSKLHKENLEFSNVKFKKIDHINNETFS